MTLLISGEPVPLRTDEAGVVRIGNTCVSLDSIIFSYKNGATAEQIAFDFSTLDLADIHAAIAYYLRHREEVERYLVVQKDQANAIRKRIEPVGARGGIRERVLVRLTNRENKNAADFVG